jgi:hypothetical protein
VDIKDMHYDFKTKLNKIDSQQFRNLKVPEIDWKLNEASELFVKMIANPRVKNSLGFETSQRSIDDIRTVVVDNHCFSVTNNIAALPANYWHFLRGRVSMSKGTCTNIQGVVYEKQHDDEFEESLFDRSSFEWRHVNATFNEHGLRLYNDGTFTNTNLCISYIKKLQYIHNAEDFRAGGYTLPSGVVLTGTNSSELPNSTHREIVDIAVFLAAGDLQLPDWQQKQNKVNLNIPL